MSETKSSFLKSPLVLLLAPTLVILAAYYFVLVPLLDRSVAAQSADAFAIAEAARVDLAIGSRKNELAAVGRDSAIVDALNARDLTQALQLSQYWQRAIEGASRVVLLPFGELGHAGLGEFDSLVTNNIERNIVSRANKESAVFVDLYVKGGQQHLIFAAPVINSNNLDVGVVFLELEPAWLQSVLGSKKSDEEDVHTKQLSRLVMSGSERVVLAESARGLPANAQADASAGLAELEQVVVETSSASTSLVTKAFGAMLGLTGAVVAIMGLALPAQRERKVREKLSRDAEKLSQFFTGSLRGSVTVPRLEFDELHDLAMTVKHSVARFKDDEQARDGLEHQLQAQGHGVAADDSKSEADLEQAEPTHIPEHIFRAYDVRGSAGEDLPDDVVRRIGQAFASQLIEAGESIVALGCDSRLSSPRLIEQVREGLSAAGCAVIDLGLVPTPLLYFAAVKQANGNGVMVTGSHNPADQNGFKFMFLGHTYVDDELQLLLKRASDGDFVSGEASGTRYDCIDDYVDACAEDVVFASPVKVVIDCCNGAASEVAPILFASLGAEVIPLFAEPDGSFPNHPPNPIEENLHALVAEVQNQGADLGLAFDGDADRVVAVSPSGKVVQSDQLLMLFAKDILARNPGSDVVYDVKCSRALNALVAGLGGRPVLWKSGHSRIKQKMRETGALLGGEFSGHFFFAERWLGFDDGLYAGARLIELLTLESNSLDEALSGLPESINTDEIRLAVADERKFAVVEQVADHNVFDSADKNTVDGLRAEFSDGWGLLRASNTGAELTARFEADNPEALERIAGLFAEALNSVDPQLQLKI